MFSSFVSQTISFKNEFGRPLKFYKVLVSKGGHKDTLITNKMGGLTFKTISNFDSLSIILPDTIISMNQLEILNNNYQFITSTSDYKSLPIFETKVESNTQLTGGLSELNHQVVSTKEIYNSNVSSGAELLLLSDGVTIQKSSFGGGSPIIRGFEANRILLMVDGVRMNNAIYRGGHLQNSITVDPFIIENCEIIFGSSAVSYGSDAIGGVIHYKTKDPILLSKEDSTNFSGNYFIRTNSATREISNHVNFGFSKEKIATISSFTYKTYGDVTMGKNRFHEFSNWGLDSFNIHTANYVDSKKINPNPNIQKGIGFNQLDLTNKILFQPNIKTKIILNSQYSTTSNLSRFDQLNNIDSSGSPQFSEWAYGPQIRLLNALSFQKKSTHLMFDNLNINVSHQLIEESRITRNYNSLLQNNRTEIVNVVGSNIQLLKSINPITKLIYGSETYYNNVNSSAFSINIFNSDSSNISSRYPSGGGQTFFSALYGNINIKRNHFSLVAGARYTWNYVSAKYLDNNLPFITNDFEIKRQSLSGSINTIFYPSQHTKIHWEINTGFRAPNIDDLGKTFFKDQFLTVPNTSLVPEYSYNSSIGISAEKYFDNLYLNFSASTFATLLENAIVKQSYEIDGWNIINYDSNEYQLLANQNNETAFVYGFSSSLKVVIKEKLHLSSSVCYTRGLILNSEFPMGHIPPLFGKLNFKYLFKKFEFSLFSLFNGDKKIKDFGEGNIDNLSEASPDGYPRWWVINTQLGYQYRESLNLSLGLYNLLDVHFKTFASGISAPGRSLMVSAKLSF